MRIRTNGSKAWMLRFILCALATPNGLQGTGAPPKKKSKAEASSPAQTPKTAQPKLVALPVKKCFACKTAVRKRIAVMPVKVNVLSAELQMPGEVVATKVRDELEARVAESPGLLAVSRAELGDVLAEQRLTATGAFNQELAPQRGRLIPAQVLLVMTVDRVDVTTATQQESSSSAERYIRAAVQKENAAATANSEAGEIANEELEDEGPSTGEHIGRVLSETCFADFWCPPNDFACANRKAEAKQECENRKQEYRREQAARDKERHQAAVERRQRKVQAKRQEARALLAEASNLRRTAEIEAQKDVTEKRTTKGSLVVTWKAIDTSTAAVIASASTDASASQTQTGVSRQGAFSNSSATDSTRHDVLINKIIGDAVSKVAREVDSKLEAVPFRAKVVKVESRGITINAGKNLGVAVGDTFGVREKREVLTDPDTGLPLDKIGPPIGIIRVAEVFEKAAFAQIVEKMAAPVQRGDELEWIGMYFTEEELSSRSSAFRLSPNIETKPDEAASSYQASRLIGTPPDPRHQ